MKDKVCAVIVTYNRLDLLKRAVLALDNQTFPVNEIIIVNNGSTDLTASWLKTQPYKVINQSNTGGAGGFYTGMLEACKTDCNYIWVMDDDGHASSSCLASLLKSEARTVYQDNVVLCSMVVNESNPEELSFHLPDLSSRYYYFFDHYKRQTNKIDDILQFNDPYGYPWGFFFNSILFPKCIIEKIGLPKKEFFIWGDEVEYFNRVRKHAFKVYMIKNSIFFHPKMQSGQPARWKQMYQIRNYVYIHKVYKPFPIIHHLKTFFEIIKSGNFFLLRPFYHGLKNDFQKNYK